MKKYVVERNLPGAENLSPVELQDMARTFCDAAFELGESYVWLESFITTDKIYCIVLAESEGVIREHARRGKMTVNIISEMKTIISPATCDLPVE